MISFTVSKRENNLIKDIAQRACVLASRADGDYELMDAEMDITAAHANGCRLRLKELRDADEFDFVHDVFGIRRHLNRQTGALESFFVPRYAERTTQ